jgi:hypothetical protein
MISHTYMVIKTLTDPYYKNMQYGPLDFLFLFENNPKIDFISKTYLKSSNNNKRILF